MNNQVPRKRWDSLEDRLQVASSAGEHAPPYPALLSDAIWLVFRIDREVVEPLIPPELTMSPSLIGVMGVYASPTGSRLSPYTRSICAVAIEGHDSPDTKEAVYIVGDVVTPGAAAAIQTHYVAAGLNGEPRIWWENELLHGSVSTGGADWLRVVVRPSGPMQQGVTGIDAYVSSTPSGLRRHIVSYFGPVAPAEVVSLEMTEDAPVPFRALRPTDIVLALRASSLHATWGETSPITVSEPATTRQPEGGVRDPVDMLRSVKLTPAEARLAVLIGKGSSAREAAQQLNISENTARSTLKQVYGKLGIRKQSELGHLIARLQFGTQD